MLNPINSAKRSAKMRPPVGLLGLGLLLLSACTMTEQAHVDQASLN